MIKLSVDCMGSDNGPKVLCEAIKKFVNTYQDSFIYACGDEKELESLKNIDRIKIVHTSEVVPMECGAMQVMRMKDSSMMKVFSLYNEEKLDGAVSAGSTGGFLSLATLKLKLIKNIERAALTSPFPTKIGKPVVVLDIGASNENNAKQLCQFAKMGRIYSQTIFNVKEPKVYLLSNGTEEKKGSPVGKEAYQLLKESNFPSFMGNMEAREGLSGEADVLVSEGYTGNVFLKSSEGMAKMMSEMTKEAFKKNVFTMIGYLFSQSGFKKMKEKMNYKNYGGAILLGVNGVVVKAHGNSDDYSFFKALELAYKMASTGIVEKLKEGFENDDH
ncbi:phosphate acyltransferase [Firmicutes bacterium CAG:449]|nr:phosphate acyltransferase [Firmicutes bacterium CAG:449]